MKKVFINEKALCHDDNLFNYEMYMKACTEIANDIKNKYDLSDPELGFLGIARGGLPILVTVSQLLNYRNISIIQCKMTNSDKPHDYGDFKRADFNLDYDDCDAVYEDDIKSIVTKEQFASMEYKIKE